MIVGGATSGTMGDVGAKMTQEQLAKCALANIRGVTTGEGDGKINPRRRICLGNELKNLEVVRVGQDVGWETGMGVVVPDRVLDEVLGGMQIQRFLNGIGIDDKSRIFDGPFPVGSVPLEGCPVPGSSRRLDCKRRDHIRKK